MHHYQSHKLFFTPHNPLALYWSLDIGKSYAFAKTHNPQREYILLYEIEIYLPKAGQYVLAISSL